MKINPLCPIIFKKNVLKSEWLKGNLPTVQKGIYGGVLSKDNISLEHINCKCFGGKTKTFNLALATQELNNLRGNKPLKLFLDGENFIAYLKQFESVDLPNFNGMKYIEELIKTVIKVLKENR